MEASPVFVGQVKGLGILTIWELRYVWIRLWENQQTHPVILTFRDSGQMRTKEGHTFSHPSGSQHPQPGWVHCEWLSLCVLLLCRPLKIPQGPAYWWYHRRTPGSAAPNDWCHLLQVDPLMYRGLPPVCGRQSSCCRQKSPCRAPSPNPRGNSDPTLGWGHFCFAFLLEEESSRTGISTPPPDLVWAFGVLRTGITQSRWWEVGPVAVPGSHYTFAKNQARPRGLPAQAYQITEHVTRGNRCHRWATHSSFYHAACVPGAGIPLL